jgi:predicted transcriptional regulator
MKHKTSADARQLRRVNKMKNTARVTRIINKVELNGSAREIVNNYELSELTARGMISVAVTGGKYEITKAGK